MQRQRIMTLEIVRNKGECNQQNRNCLKKARIKAIKMALTLQIDRDLVTLGVGRYEQQKQREGKE